MGLADSFDDAVTLYDTARPGYPADAIAWAMPEHRAAWWILVRARGFSPPR